MNMAVPGGGLDALLAVLQARGHDFREYRRETLERRVADWLGSNGVGDVARLSEQIRDDAPALAALADFLRVSTSSLFRDRSLFEALERIVVPGLVAVAAAAGRPVRAWVAGVATGEEAWSLAMLLDAATSGTDHPAEVFASDVSLSALEVARRGVYRAEAAHGLPPALRRHVVERGDQVVIAEPLRRRVTFCHHDLLGPRFAPAEAVLARFDLIMCCNVLIYLEDGLQQRLLGRLVGQLEPHGVLGIGRYEQLPSEIARLVETIDGVDAAVHLFRRRRSP